MALTSEATQLLKAGILEIATPVQTPPKLQSVGNVLPGQPRVSLEGRDDLLEYLREAFLTLALDRLAPRLWLITTPVHTHIFPLHHQSARNRAVIPIEAPHLHLVWYHNQIFIKPIPRYLLSHAFWTYVATEDKDVHQAAAGFLRTYSYLIKYEIDFRKAQDAGLIPLNDGQDAITFEGFAKFIAPFAKVENDAVSPRYQYGELRLTRLNWMARLFLRKLTYHHINVQWASYLNIFVAPFLTVFLILSTILSAMQVELAVESIEIDSVRTEWKAFVQACHGFSIAVIVFVAVVVAITLSIAMFVVIHEQWFARRLMRHKDRAEAFKRKQSAVV